MSKHTPGPWTAGVLDEWPSGAPINVTPAPNGPVICTMSKSQSLPHRANARLIAAAPDLLGAVTALLEPLAECRWDHNGYCQAHYLDHSMDGCRVEKARAAIAKATQ